VPDGPHLAPRSAHGTLSPGALAVVWHDRRLRASVLGYFGHMGELYALIVLLPAIIALRIADGTDASWWAFAAIAAGTIGCVGGGVWARRLGGARVAGLQLACSGTCALLAPWLIEAPLLPWALWLLLWGLTVSGDSPQFSALTATNAPRALVGSVLTLVNSIGFAISTATIVLFVHLASMWPLQAVLPWLAVGPVIGVWCLRPLWR
jgi:MFS transporter, DHA1 family, inner membrane transport protein